MFIYFLQILFSITLSFGQESVCYHYDINESSVMNPMFIKCMRQGDTIFLDGAVDTYLIYELTTYAEQPIKRVVLNSLGGEVDAALEVARWIRKNNIETYVRSQAVCMSACTVLFQAGTIRKAHVSSKFMYHTARSMYVELPKDIQNCQDNPNEECKAKLAEMTTGLEQATKKLFDLYTELGMPESFYQNLVEMGEDPDWIQRGNLLKLKNWYMTAEETKGYNVVQDLVDDEEMYLSVH